MTEPQTWYIVKRQHQKCEIIPRRESPKGRESHCEPWGPLNPREADRSRIALIRDGKCQPHNFNIGVDFYNGSAVSQIQPNVCQPPSLGVPGCVKGE
jgi:hypothetical protein